MQTEKTYTVKGFKVSIIEKPAFEAVGFSEFVRLDGNSIGAFIRKLTEDGRTLTTFEHPWFI